MRVLRSLTVLSLLVASGVGCAELPESRSHRRNVPMEEASSRKPEERASEITVAGRLSSEGDGLVEQGLGGRDLLEAAKTVEVFALDANGALTPVAKADVQPGGAFEVKLPDGGSPTDIFILQAKNLAGAIVGSGVVNGLPAFVKAFVIDATIDTATSFKAEILTTLAKKGVPGVQNYLNVINAYVDAQLANSIAVIGVLATDLNALIGATSEAIFAAATVIGAALEQAGLPVDLTALANAQSAAVSGLQGLVTSASGELVTGAKDLVASLQAATAKAAAPIDQAIFNAIVNGGVAFGSTFKSALPSSASAKLGFAASQSVFQLEAEVATGWIEELFQQTGVGQNVLDAVTKACRDFLGHVVSARSVGDLGAAKAGFKNGLVGKDGAPSGIIQLIAKAINDLTAVLRQVDATFRPLAEGLVAAVSSQPFDASEIGRALAEIDAGTQDLPASFEKVVNGAEAKAIAEALRLVEKAIVP